MNSNAARKLAAAAIGIAIWACGLPSSPDSVADGGPDGTLFPDAGDVDTGPGLDVADALPLQLSSEDTLAFVGEVSWAGAEWQDDSYHFRNDLGVSFRVRAFETVVRSVQLRPCEVASLESWWQPALAYADHVAIDDTTMVLSNYTQDLMRSEPVLLGVARPESTEYCKAFLLSTVSDVPGGQPGDFALAARGEFLLPDHADWVPFDVSVALSNGRIATLTTGRDRTEAMQALSPEANVMVSFVRSPVAAFDGLRPDELSATEFAWQLLGGVLTSTEAEVR